MNIERRPDAGPLSAQDWGEAVAVALLACMWAFTVLMVVVWAPGGRVGW